MLSQQFAAPSKGEGIFICCSLLMQGIFTIVWLTLHWIFPPKLTCVYSVFEDRQQNLEIFPPFSGFWSRAEQRQLHLCILIYFVIWSHAKKIFSSALLTCNKSAGRFAIDLPNITKGRKIWSSCQTTKQLLNCFPFFTDFFPFFSITAKCNFEKKFPKRGSDFTPWKEKSLLGSLWVRQWGIFYYRW